MKHQEQFLNVVDRDEAERRFHQCLELTPLSIETVPLSEALDRVLAKDLRAPLDVPSFDRSNYDGFALQAADTINADEENPRVLRLTDEVIATAVIPQTEIIQGTATVIATGGMLPRGADAVLMIEHSEVSGNSLLVHRSVTSGFGISFAGTDIGAGEIILRQGEILTSRETGVLAAVGISEVPVWRKPSVAVISTGDEIIPPGQLMKPGLIFDSNGRIIADAIKELGAQPVEFDIVPDDPSELEKVLHHALAECDAVILSGGTSKGAGDICYRVVRELTDPGIVAHGVALKPGKPICLAVSDKKPVVILPGFPTSAIFTFHEFVAPVLRSMAGRPAIGFGVAPAKMAVKVNSEIGRTEYLLVGLVPPAGDSSADSDLPVAFPMGKGSGSVTSFSRADGFVTIGRHQEILDAQEEVTVRLLGRNVRVADLIVVGSHCVGLDFLLSELHSRGWRTKFLSVGSTAGLDAAERGECDLAGIHLLDPVTDQYNIPYLSSEVELVPGYGRLQGIVFRKDDERFRFATATETVDAIATAPDCMMVNRNQGSGTRILIEGLLGNHRPSGYAIHSKSHNAVAAAVAQGRADWGVAIETVAKQSGLGFLPLREEQYDFVIPRSRRHRAAVQALIDLLAEDSTQKELRELGFRIP